MKKQIVFIIFIILIGFNHSNAQEDILKKDVDSLKTKFKSLKAGLDSLKSSSNDPFSFSLGASFDFINKLSATDLYYDVNFFIPKIWKNKKDKKGQERWGIDVGIYQNRFFSIKTNTIDIDQKPIAIGKPINDSINVVDNLLVRTRTESYDNLGVFFSPTYHLIDSLYIVGHIESVFQNKKISFVDTLATSDTLKIPISNYEAPTNPINYLKPGKSESRNKSMANYFGIGLLLNLNIINTEKYNVKFRLKPVIGYYIGKDEYREPVEEAFYLVDFALTEQKSGFKLGGQIRGLFPMKNQENLPQFSLFLSKQFSLTKLYDLVSK